MYGWKYKNDVCLPWTHFIGSVSRNRCKTTSWSQSLRGEECEERLCWFVCFMILHHNDGHINIFSGMRTASRCYQEKERRQEPNAHTHTAYLYVYSINSLCLFGCLGNEDVQKRFQGSDRWAAYIRHEKEMEEEDRSAVGSAAGQRLPSYSPSHTQRRAHTPWGHAAQHAAMH